MGDNMKHKSVLNLHEKLHKHDLEDNEFGKKLVRVYCINQFKNIYIYKNVSLCNHLLTSIQRDHGRRKELRDENETECYNAISLFSEYLSRKSVKSSVIYSGFLNYMEMLIETSTAKDTKLFTEYMTVHGKRLCLYCKEQTDNDCYKTEFNQR